jgi:peptide/nickel transport system permease protein
MWSFTKRILQRLLIIPLTLFIITALLYGVVMISPPDARAELYMPPNAPRIQTAEMRQTLVNRIIAENGLDDPYPVQYIRWARRLLQGDWGYSPVFSSDVLPLLRLRVPVTLELTFYSVLVLIPLAVLSGAVAGWRVNGRLDTLFRVFAFLGTAVPPFILGLFLLSIFYVGLDWFAPSRSSFFLFMLENEGFRTFTGFLTIDGLLNGRLDVTLDAFRHLVLPVFTLSLLHWATISRVTRVAIVEEKSKEYITAARARGLPRTTVLWRHAFRNVLLPAMTAGTLSAASLVTGVFVIEEVFTFNGLSELLTASVYGTPDAPLLLGFAIFSVLLVLPIMVVLDIIKLLIDPRLREEG